MTAMSPGRSRLVRFLVRRSSRAATVTPGSVGACRARRERKPHRGAILPADADGARTAERALPARRQRPRRRRSARVQQLRRVRAAVLESARPASIRDSSRTRPVAVERGHAAARDGPSRLRDHEVVVGEGRDLRQVGHDEDLRGPGQPGQPPPTSTAARPPTPASTSSNTNVGTGSAPAKHDLDREHDPATAHRRTRPCASGRAGRPGARPAAARPRRRRAGRTRAVARRPSSPPASSRRDLHGHVRLRHGQRDELGGDRRAEAGRRLGASRAHLAGKRAELRRRGRRVRRSAGDALVLAVELRKPQRRPARPRPARRRRPAPYLRVRPASAARRSSTAASRIGSASTLAAYEARSLPRSLSR